MRRHPVRRLSEVSLRTKITGVTVLVLTLGLLVAGAGTSILLKRVLLGQIDSQLTTVANSQAGFTSFLDQAGGESSREATLSSVYIAVYYSDGTLARRNWSSAPAGPSLKHMDLAEAYSFDGSRHIFPLESAAGATHFHGLIRVVDLPGGTGVGYALIAISTDPVETVLGSFVAIFLGFGALVVVIGAILTRILVTSTFAPLRAVEDTAAAIAAGDFSQRLSGPTPNTEVGRLTRSLNTMLNRLDGSLRDRSRTIEQMRRFVGDASHELRTPLVSVRGYAELYRMGALPDPDAVGQAMERIEKEAIRMGGLVEDLLELARLDETKPLQLTEVDLVPLARDAALDATAANPGRSVTVDVADRPLSIPPVISARHDAPDAPGRPTPPSPDGPGEPWWLRPADDAGSADATPRAGGGDASGRGLPPGAARRPAPDPTDGGESGSSTSTGPIAFAGATLARLRGRRPRRPEGEATLGGGEREADGDATRDAMPDDAPRPVVFAEEDKLRQIVANLIGNAVRYTPARSPIEIGVGVDPGREQAVLEVRDHGPGIPPEIREKIFQRFWRADTSRTRETGGSGLGLAIVSSIAAAHRGSVEVDDTPGGGATFRLRLPLAETSDSPDPGEDPDAAPSAADVPPGA